MGDKMMSDEDVQKGKEVFAQMYGDVLPVPADMDKTDFGRFTLGAQFAQLWSRTKMSARDRRLMVLGVNAALGEREPFEIHLRAAVGNGEIERDQLREIPLILTQYIGYPRTGPILAIVEKILAEPEKKKTKKKKKK